jgi:hypothetical protein
MENLAARYRGIADQVRARAENAPDEQTRINMMRAAEIWDRLATLSEKAVPTIRQSIGGRTRP